MDTKRIAISIAALFLASSWGVAHSAPVTVEAVVSPKEQIRLDFTDGSRHFVAMVRRDGKSTGNGPLAGADVSEYGYHDVVPGEGGDPRGYLTFSKDGGQAYIKWTIRAVFVPGPEGKPVLLDQGFWEMVGGTAQFKGMKGAGTIHLKGVSPTDRKFILTGDLVPAL
ncbi:MAG: hypothetical protein ACXW2D_13025, partial [Burkholderiaceae bacterium]